MIPLNLMRMTGRINSFCLLPTSSFFPPAAFFDAYPSSLMQGEREEKEFQGAKVFPDATKDISKCFLQINVYFPISP